MSAGELATTNKKQADGAARNNVPIAHLAYNAPGGHLKVAECSIEYACGATPAPPPPHPSLSAPHSIIPNECASHSSSDHHDKRRICAIVLAPIAFLINNNQRGLFGHFHDNSHKKTYDITQAIQASKVQDCEK